MKKLLLSILAVTIALPFITDFGQAEARRGGSVTGVSTTTIAAPVTPTGTVPVYGNP